MTAVICKALGGGGVDLEVACDFGAGYVDITQYVRVDSRVAVTRGRADERSTAQPAILKLALRNTDGRFTPKNIASPYFPGVKFRTPIRVRVRKPATSGTWFTRFTGFVDEWPIVWPSQKPIAVAWSQISATGVLRRLAQQKRVLSPTLRTQVASLSPSAWWPLDDPVSAVSAVGGSPLTATDPALVHFASVAGTPGMGAAQVAKLDAFGELRMGPQPFVPLSLEIWWQWGAYASSEFLAFLSGVSGFSYLSINQFDTPGIGKFAAHFAGSRIAVSPASTPATTNGFWHVVATLSTAANATKTLRLYVNGVQVASDTGFDSGYDTFYSGYLRHGAEAAVAHAAIYSTVLSAGNVLANYNAGLGYAGETVAARFDRVCAANGVSTAGTPTAVDTMGPQPSAAFLDTIADAVAVDGGMLYESLTGTLGVQGRTVRYNPATYMTLAIPGQLDGLSYVPDDQRVLTSATVTRTGGSSATYTDTTDDAAWGTYDASPTLNFQTDDPLYDAAAWLVNTAPDPNTARFPALPFTFAGASDSTALDAWLAGEPLGAMLALTGLPLQAADSSTKVFVEGYTETWGYDRCEVKANCSNAAPYDRVFIVGTGGALSVLGLSSKTVNANITNSATSLGVASAVATLVSTAAGDYPRDWRNVNTGEVFTVTAVAGAASPQTATITRAAGSKAMTAGDVLELAVKPVLAR